MTGQFHEGDSRRKIIMFRGQKSGAFAATGGLRNMVGIRGFGRCSIGVFEVHAFSDTFQFIIKFELIFLQL